MKHELLPLQIIFTPRKRKKREKKKKKDILFKKPEKRRLSRFFCQNTTRSETRCGDCDKNPEGLTFTAGKRNGYLCIFIFFLAENVLCFFIVLFYIVLNFELSIKSYLQCIDLHYILPEGHLKTTTAKYSGVGGRGLAWEKQV